MKKHKAIIEITQDGNGKINVHCEFEPSIKKGGAISTVQEMAWVAIEAIGAGQTISSAQVSWTGRRWT